MINKAVIPLYINSDMLNNLFTIVIQEFVEIKSKSTKDLVTIHLKSPISEFSYDLFGKYIQGEFELVLQNEYMKQRTEEKISTVIVILKQLKDILSSQGILKKLDEMNDFSSVQENDFIEFTTNLQPNPVLKRVNDIVEYFELENILGLDYQDEKKCNHIKETVIPTLKQGLNQCKDEMCIRYMGYPTYHNSSVIVTPIKRCCMMDYESYLLNGKVSIMGKVVKKYSKSNDDTAVSLESSENYKYNVRRQILSHTAFDNLDLKRLTQRIGEVIPGIDSRFDENTINVDNVDSLIEIIPISIVI